MSLSVLVTFACGLGEVAPASIERTSVGTRLVDAKITGGDSFRRLRCGAVPKVILVVAGIHGLHVEVVIWNSNFLHVKGIRIIVRQRKLITTHQKYLKATETCCQAS